MPLSPRTMICSCEDITLADVKSCIERGYRDIESIKRYTGLGTGICQGRSCLALISRLLASGSDGQGTVEPFTQRPPLHPVALGLLGSLDDDGLPVESATGERRDEGGS